MLTGFLMREERKERKIDLDQRDRARFFICLDVPYNQYNTLSMREYKNKEEQTTQPYKTQIQQRSQKVPNQQEQDSR